MLLLLRRRTTNHVIPRHLRNYTLWLTTLHRHHRNDVTFFRLLALTRGLLVAEKCVLLFCVVVIVVPVVVHGVCKGLIIDPLVYNILWCLHRSSDIRRIVVCRDRVYRSFDVHGSRCGLSNMYLFYLSILQIRYLSAENLSLSHPLRSMDREFGPFLRLVRRSHSEKEPFSRSNNTVQKVAQPPELC